MRRLLLCLTGVLWLALLTSCATVSRVHPDEVKLTSARRLAQVMQVATREEIKSLGEHYQHLLASGIQDSDLRDGSLGVGRTYCCGGPNEKGMAVWLYVPPGMTVEVGDIVEVKMGRRPDGKDSGAVNTAVRIRQKGTSGSCRWVPPDERLWMRILYCDWMQEEGWVEGSGAFWEAWYKPASLP